MNKKYDKQIGEILKAERMEKQNGVYYGASLVKEIADKMGIGEKIVYDREEGRRSMRVVDFVEHLQALGLSREEIKMKCHEAVILIMKNKI